MIEKIRNACKEKKVFSFGIVWCLFALVLFIKNYGNEVGVINSSMMAFSYKYGFISRGFVGSVYQVLNKITPFDMMNYDSVMKFTFAITMIFYVILFAFFIHCLMMCSKKISEEIKYIILFYSIMAVPMFITYEHFGRLDIYCVMFSLIGVILLLWEKAELLLIPLAALGVMVHQGNVFMFLNIILILLLYKAMSYVGKKRIKYVVLLLSCFGVASVLFLYFEFFSHMNGANIYDEIVSIAQSLGRNGGIHRDVIDHEILGIDLSEREIIFRYRNAVEFPIYIVLMFPYIVLGVTLFRNIIKAATTKLDKWKYFLISIGAATMLPMLILKCDYGRWMFAIVSYYAVVILALLGMKDTIVELEMKKMFDMVNSKFSAAIILLIYPILLHPYLDVEISGVVSQLADKVNTLFLHWW